MKKRYDLIRDITDICFENGGVTKPMADKLADYMENALKEEFERGKKVSEYQVAERLYGDVVNIYLFKDGGTIKAPELRENADEHARELLKDCEKYMNSNAKVYSEYVRALIEEEKNEKVRN